MNVLPYVHIFILTVGYDCAGLLSYDPLERIEKNTPFKRF
jgi:hypothetical protein